MSGRDTWGVDHETIEQARWDEETAITAAREAEEAARRSNATDTSVAHDTADSNARAASHEATTMAKHGQY